MKKIVIFALLVVGLRIEAMQRVQTCKHLELGSASPEAPLFLMDEDMRKEKDKIAQKAVVASQLKVIVKSASPERVVRISSSPFIVPHLLGKVAKKASTGNSNGSNGSQKSAIVHRNISPTGVVMDILSPKEGGSVLTFEKVEVKPVAEKRSFLVPVTNG
jgi:hypothetical protein